MTLLEHVTFFGKVVAATWRHGGSRLLWSVAAACAATAIAVRTCAYLQLPKADTLWSDYGLMLVLAAVGFAVIATCKTYFERHSRDIVLVPDIGQSFWQHVTQNDGTRTTQFSLHFQATNSNGAGWIFLSNLRLNRPWVHRGRVLTSMLSTQDPLTNEYSDHGIQAHRRRWCMAHLTVLGTVGGVGRKKPMRVSIGVQDNFGRWHQLTFRDVPDVARSWRYRPVSWGWIAMIAACTAVALAAMVWIFMRHG